MKNYKYAIQILFDKRTELSIKKLIESLRQKGFVNDEYINKNYTPHITLAVFENMDEQYGNGVVRSISEDINIFEVEFPSIGIFNGDIKALYLSPVFTEMLRSLHLKIIDAFSTRPEKNWELYDENKWVPHCGILIDDEEDKILRALTDVVNFKLNDITIQKIQLTGFKDSHIYSLNK
jgi:2'-5' RNA ligase